MAKGMRSKSKRANRAVLRTKLITPMIVQRQERLSSALKDSIRHKTGDTLQALTGVFIGIKNDSENMIEDAQTIDMSSEVVAPVLIKKVIDNKVIARAVIRNAGKTLVWFH
jgi:Protein of unknown function (DUF2423)